MRCPVGSNGRIPFAVFVGPQVRKYLDIGFKHHPALIEKIESEASCEITALLPKVYPPSFWRTVFAKAIYATRDLRQSTFF